MIKNGYPASAFEVNIVPPSKSEFINQSEMSEDEFQKVVAEYIEMETHRKAGICFASQEDVKNKANGNYFYYFK